MSAEQMSSELWAERNGEARNTERIRPDLSLVTATGDGCRIYRETSGVFAVSHPHHPGEPLRVATLPCAYAACREWERSEPGSHPEGRPGPGVPA